MGRESEVEARRREAWKALLDGLDAKLTRHRAGEALSRLQEAHSLATKPTRLPGLMPAIIAYRLAHLMLRSARSPEDLRRVEALLGEAIACDCWLGPLPGCVHLAVLHRLKATGKTDSIEARISEAFDRLRTQVAFHGQEEAAVKAAKTRQSHALNLLELTTYFLGHDYSSLEGIGVQGYPDPFVGLRDGEPWLLISTHGFGTPAQMPHPFAEHELRGLVEADLVDVGILFDGGTGQAIVRGCDKKLPSHAGLLLAASCTPRTKEDLQRLLKPDFHKPLERGQKALAALLHRSPDVIHSYDNQTGRYRFVPGLRVAVALPAKRWVEPSSA